MALRRAENVWLEFMPRLFSSRGYMTVHVGKTQHFLDRKLTRQEFDTGRQWQLSQPVFILSTGDRNLWQFQDRFYWETDHLDGSAIYALLVTRAQRDQQRVERAQAIMAMGATPRQPARGAIPDDVKQYVWQRDGGRCRQCGSPQELQFDHVIPVAMGGASTAENLQVLCGPCNRRKGAGLTSGRG
jgi:hypothetical protein